jgi:hypothetical protein
MKNSYSCHERHAAGLISLPAADLPQDASEFQFTRLLLSADLTTKTFKLINCDHFSKTP